ncbi:MAG: hypothetical protein D6733_05240 [Methanobacteriota archaeon]|nr:MAG: hypothetical protein D6733_05240 [Euryarchaeota archaeon]
MRHLILPTAVFIVGAAVIVHLFSMPLVELEELSTGRAVHDGGVVEVLGRLSPSDRQLPEEISFEEEVQVYTLEDDEGHNVLVAYPGEAEGFVLVKGKYIPLDLSSGAPGFIYAGRIRSAWPVEWLGVSKEGIAILAFYTFATGASFFYELRKVRLQTG